MFNLRNFLKKKPNYIIPFDDFTTIAGHSTFMRNLRTYFDSTKFPYKSSSQNKMIEDMKKVGVYNTFFPVELSLNVLDFIKQNKGRIIQRLDGVFHPSKNSKEEIERQENIIKKIYTSYADHIVFQSEYSKAQCFEMFGEIPEVKYSIIINGVNHNIFKPVNKYFDPKKIIFCTTGNFRNPAMIEPIILALDEIKDFNFELRLVGPTDRLDEKTKELLNREYIVHVVEDTPEGVAKELNKSDIFLYSHLNPPCPNSVLEAIACGLPIVGFDSGAMSELLYFNWSLLAPVSKDLFQKYEDFDYKLLKEKIKDSVVHFNQHKETAMENAGLYSFKECGAKYAEILSATSIKPLRDLPPD